MNALESDETTPKSIDDEVMGDVQLCWPPSVPWICDKPNSKNKGTDKERDALPEEAICHNRSAEGLSSFLYEKTLEQHEFRLICLTAAEDSNQPIHLMLETYPRNACPEYETVSYTWAGEDGDMSRFNPVYFGSYWDLSPQTKNCWSLLRYLRPSRGLRLIWIDAICINQKDTLEKQSQVSAMYDIYRHCTRVVVWLGEDIVDPPSTKYRPRHELHKIKDHLSDEREIHRIFSRRYFNRVWVIQELVLAPRSVFPIFHMEFLADISTPKQLASAYPDWNWDSLGVPWLQNIHAGNLLQDVDFYDLLVQTSISKATDPHDKIFGLIGLGQDGEINAQPLHADYSLSISHVRIGIFAYCFANLGRHEVLLNAAGMHCQTSCPSWMPDIRHDWISRYQLYPSNKDIRALRPNIQSQWQLQSARYMGILNTVSYDFDDFWSTLYLKDTEIPHEESWRSNITFDTIDGSVSLSLIYLARISSPPTLRRGPSDSGLCVFSIRTASCELCMCTEHFGSDSPVCERLDHLFLLQMEDRKDLEEELTDMLPGGKWSYAAVVVVLKAVYEFGTSELSSLPLDSDEKLRLSKEQLEQRFIDMQQILSAQIGITIEPTYIEIRFEPHQWKSFRSSRQFLSRDVWEVRQESSWIYLIDAEDQDQIAVNKPVHVKWTIKEVYNRLMGVIDHIYCKRFFYRYFPYVCQFAKIVGEDVFAMLQREPRPEDSITFCESVWPESVVEELGMDGKHRRVRII
ncbi:MAG: hypothetical protein Q9227_000508 [Pyrenula ochraceoflavens]